MSGKPPAELVTALLRAARTISDKRKRRGTTMNMSSTSHVRWFLVCWLFVLSASLTSTG